jgi:SAM-dependent methyltransferase
VTAYASDLAYIHHTGFTGHISKAAPGLLRLLGQSRMATGLVVDLGCGSGVWARALCAHGYRVLGIDISPSMIRLARRQAPQASFRVGSLFTVKLPPCDAVTCIGECVNYAFDRHGGKAGLMGFFRRVYDALGPGGVFMFDVLEPGIVPDVQPHRRFLEGPDWAILLEVREDHKRNLLTRRIVSFRGRGNLYRRSEERHDLHLYSRADVRAALIRAGFQAKLLPGYGSFKFSPRHAVFMARKPV